MTSVFEIFAKLGLDSSDFDKGLNDAKSTLSSMGSAVGSGLGTIAKIGTAAVASASAGIAALGTMAVKGYADYEQLTGGVETLYKDSYDKIAQYAQDAYKTAGMAANEYMDMSIKTGAAMIASVGGDTEKAADLMNTSITDMADNVNKMGTNMEDVQNAYRGFSRGNFTMLDNLALGFSGTKEGMQQLLDKAQELTGLHYDINSYADIAQAIHEVQVEMGIAGTTAKEASETISGSVASMKSAWSNLVAGLANDDADLGQLIDNVVVSAETAFNNILPVAERALMGIGQLVTDLAPIIGQKLPELITTLLPQIIDTGAQFIGALGQGILTNLPTMLDTASQVLTMFVHGIVTAVPSLLDGAAQIIAGLGTFLIENAPTLMESAVQLVIDLANFIAQNADKTIDGVIALIVAINEAFYENIPQIIPAIVEMVAQIALAIITHIPDVIVAIVRLYSDMIQAIWKSKDQFFDAVSNILVMILNTIVDYGTQMLSNVGQFLTQLLTDTNQGMSDTFNKIVEWLTQIPPKMAYYAGYAIGEFIKFVIQLPSKVSSIFTSVMSAVASFGTNFVNKAREMASNFFNNIVNGLASLPSMVAALGQQLVQAVENLPSKFAEIGSNIVQGIWNGISGGWDWLKRQVKHLTDGLVQGVKDGLKIKSPSRVFMGIGKMVDEGFAKGIIDNENRVMSAMQDLISIPSMDDFGTQTGGAGISAVNAGSTKWTSGYTQIINITSPTALTPYEVARQTRNATRDMFLSMRV